MLRRYTWESQKKRLQHYKRRSPETSVLYQIVYHGHEELQYVWEPRFQHQYGCLRDEVTKTLTEYLNCGILAHGAARVYCDGCKHSLLIAFSCKRRGVCPSCEAKRAVKFAEHIHSEVIEDVPHRYIERAPLSLEKLSIQDDIVTYPTKDGAAHEFDTLQFLAELSAQIPRAYESLTRYFGRYSCRRRGERAKLIPPPEDETETDEKREFPKSSWAACIKRVYEINPLECPNCKSQMRIIAFIQDEYSIKDIMKSQGIADFRAPPPIPKFINTTEAIDELPSYDSFEPAPDDF
jgi:hypothetical protein